MVKARYFLFIPILLQAQYYTISGYVKDQQSQEVLIGAQIQVQETGKGAFSNAYGYYAIRLPKGTYTLIATYLGYHNDTFKIVLNQNIRHDFLLIPSAVYLEEVVIESEEPDAALQDTRMGALQLDVQEIKTLPVLFGETDVLKMAQLLPGVQSAGEGQSGFFVRGGRFDQNLVLLDEAIVYNAAHFLGFFSVFNPDAINHFEIIKGSFPAQYGGRLASVVDVRMKEGNRQKRQFHAAIGLLASRAMIEGPIKKEKGTFLLSGRYAYAGQFLRFAPNEAVRKNVLYFYDFNAKFSWAFSDKDRIYLSGYFGKDDFRFVQGQLGWGWSNATTTLRWNHLFNDRLFLNTSIIFSRYNYDFEYRRVDDHFLYRSGIQDWTLKLDWDYFLSDAIQLKFGYQGTYHLFTPGKLIPLSDSSNVNPTEVPKRHAGEHGLYCSTSHQISRALALQYGVRLSYFALYGPLERYTFRRIEDPFPSDTAYISPWKRVADYWGIEPRFSMRWRINENNALKASYARTFQYVQAATYSSVGTPADFWMPSSDKVPPQQANQIALGWFKDFQNHQWQMSIETYYKWMINQIDFRPFAQVYLDPTYEKDILSGKGWSYGMEFLLKKRTGKWQGWIAYTLSWTRWQIPGINNGKPYPPFNDRRHDASIVLSYRLNQRWKFSAIWVFLSGQPVTLPEGKYEIDGRIIGIYNQRGNYRLPDYHRLDLSAEVRLGLKKPKQQHNSIVFGVYNAYRRRNTWSYYFERDKNDPTIQRAYKIYLFDIIPFITYNVHF